MKPLLNLWDVSNLKIKFLLLLGLTGCGGHGLHQVHGKVIYKDGSDVEVLAKGYVLFDPVEVAEGTVKSSARGIIKEDGSFRMSTSREGDGVKPGKYRVAVAPPPAIVTRKKTPPILLDQRLQDFQTSGLSYTVPGPNEEYTVTVWKP